MLQDLLRPAPAVPVRAPKMTIQPLPLEPGEADLNECSLDNLAALADVAHRAGDHASAEYLVRLLYAEYDRLHAQYGQADRQRSEVE